MSRRLEFLECVKLNNWLRANRVHWPILEMVQHIPNEGKRSQRTGAELKMMGLTAGLADYVLFAAGQIPGFKGVVPMLAIEMKAPGGKQSAEQKRWQENFEGFGGVYHLAWSANQAAMIIKQHLGLKLEVIAQEQ